MTNNDRLQQIIANVQSLSDLIKSMIDAEMYPVSFFSQGFDLIQKIQSDFHTLEADQVDMFAEQLKKHQALILSIHQQMRIFSTQTQVLIPPAIEEAPPVSYQKPLPEQLTNVTQAGSSEQPARIPVQIPKPAEQSPVQIVKPAEPSEPAKQSTEPTEQSTEPTEQAKQSPEKIVKPAEQVVKPAEQIMEPTEQPPKQTQETKPSVTESFSQGEPLKPSTVKEEAALKGEAEQNKEKTKKNSFFGRLGFSSTSKTASKPEPQDVSLTEPEKTTPPEPPVTPQAPPPLPTETPTARPVRPLPPEPPVTPQAPPPLPTETPAARPVRPISTETPVARPIRPTPSETPVIPHPRPLPTDGPAARPVRPVPPEPPVTHQAPPPLPTEARPVRPVPTDGPEARPIRPMHPDTPVIQHPRPLPTDGPAARPVRPTPPDTPIIQLPRPTPTDTPEARPVRPTPPDSPATHSLPMGEGRGGASSSPVPSFLASVGVGPTRNEALNLSASKDAQPPSINDAIEKKKLSDLRKAFSLNDRFRYRKELFGGSEDAMNKVISILNNRQSLGECVQFLEHKLHWDFSDPTVKDFIKILEIRFL